MEEKRRDSCNSPAGPSSADPESETTRLRGRALKRKAHSLSGLSSSSTPSKQVIREKSNLISRPPVNHYSPLTRARQGAPSGNVALGSSSGSDGVKLEEASAVKQSVKAEELDESEESEALEAINEAEFETIRSRDNSAHVAPNRCDTMRPNERGLHATPSTSNLPFGDSGTFHTGCFRNDGELHYFNGYFATRAVHMIRPIDFPVLEDFRFTYLPRIREWKWENFLKIRCSTHANLVRAFYSNAQLEHNSDGLVEVITSNVMGKPLRITLDDFTTQLGLPAGGLTKEKGAYDPTLKIVRNRATELDIHDRFLHLILTWNLRPISKHVVIRQLDYWWIDCFRNNRRPDLAFLMYNDIAKVIRKPLTSTATLLFGTYISYILRKLGVPTRIDPSGNHPSTLGEAALHSCGWSKKNGIWTKTGNGELDGDDGDDGAIGANPEDVANPDAPMLEVPRGPQYSTETTAILGAIQNLNERFSSFELRFNRMEENIAYLMSRHPPPQDESYMLWFNVFTTTTQNG
ncbi:hypothetical protein HRI_004363500 [Hibiscus trionum]|uniref:Uncharacterized protein n=1 Tax=Hibiscus trionum TaxID=183268 RepID=A0A9W7J5V0_HIBTR|nr:hypothetical protein HRI_004363500 [Hibiscus trionum]